MTMKYKAMMEFEDFTGYADGIIDLSEESSKKMSSEELDKIFEDAKAEILKGDEEEYGLSRRFLVTINKKNHTLRIYGFDLYSNDGSDECYRCVRDC